MRRGNPHPSKPNVAAKAAKMTEMADRRRKVAALHLARVPQYEIARQLGIKDDVVSDDLKAVRAEWNKDRKEDVVEFQARDLAALEADEGSVRRRLAILPADMHVERVRYHDLLIKIMDRRARLIGLDAPTKIEQKTEHTISRPSIANDPETIKALRDASVKIYASRLVGPAAPPSSTNGANGANGHTHP